MVECISLGLMKVCLQLGKSKGVSFLSGYAPTNNSDTAAQGQFWNTADAAILELPRSHRPVVMMGANTRTGRRGDGCSDIQMLGAYGRGRLNENEERMLGSAGDNERSVAEPRHFSVPPRAEPLRCYNKPTAERNAIALTA